MDFTPQMDLTSHILNMMEAKQKSKDQVVLKRNISQLIWHGVVILLFGNNSVILFYIKSTS